jgi:hypothetical protein
MKRAMNPCVLIAVLMASSGCALFTPPQCDGGVKHEQNDPQEGNEASVQIIGAKTLESIRFHDFASKGSYLDALIQLKTRLNETGKNWDVKLMLRDTAPRGGDGMLTNVVIAAASTIDAFEKLLRPLEEEHLARSPVYVKDIGATELVRLLCEIGGMSAAIHGEDRCIRFGPNEFFQRPPEQQWRRYAFDCAECTFDFKGFPHQLPFAESGFAFDQSKKALVFIGPPAEAELLKSFISAAGCKPVAAWPPASDHPEF